MKTLLVILILSLSALSVSSQDNNDDDGSAMMSVDSLLSDDTETEDGKYHKTDELLPKSGHPSYQSQVRS